MLVCRGEVREFGLTGLTRNQVSLTAPGVRIPPSPPSSPSPFTGWPQSIEIRASAANFAASAAAENPPNRRFPQSAANFSAAIRFVATTKNVVKAPGPGKRLIGKDPELRIPLDREVAAIL